MLLLNLDSLQILTFLINSLARLLCSFLDREGTMFSGLKFIPRDHIDEVSAILEVIVSFAYHVFVACLHLNCSYGCIMYDVDKVSCNTWLTFINARGHFCCAFYIIL